METPQGSDWMPITPHWFQWPQASVGNVTWADEDLTLVSWLVNQVKAHPEWFLQCNKQPIVLDCVVLFRAKD